MHLDGSNSIQLVIVDVAHSCIDLSFSKPTFLYLNIRQLLTIFDDLISKCADCFERVRVILLIQINYEKT